VWNLPIGTMLRRSRRALPLEIEMNARFAAVLSAIFSALLLAQERPKPLIQDYIAAVIGSPPASLNLDPFYSKYTDALGLPVVSSA